MRNVKYSMQQLLGQSQLRFVMGIGISISFVIMARYELFTSYIYKWVGSTCDGHMLKYREKNKLGPNMH